MLSVKKLLTKILGRLNAVVNNVTPTNVQNGSFSACRVVTMGSIANIYINFKTSVAMPAETTNYTIGVLPADYRPLQIANLSSSDVIGQINGNGAIVIRPQVAKAANSNIYISGVYLISA